MTTTKLTRDVLAIVREEVARMCASYKPRAKYRRCLHCHEPFRLKRDNQVFCGVKCSRRAHYLPFKVREIRKGMGS